MFKTATDLLVTIFVIGLAAFLVRNYQGTAAIAQTGTGFVTGTLGALFGKA